MPQAIRQDAKYDADDVSDVKDRGLFLTVCIGFTFGLPQPYAYISPIALP
ncbi:uncharacterized protein METZ01_LOCUS362681, partial [marine metagenome]